jgi:hypothetical protein
MRTILLLICITVTNILAAQKSCETTLYNDLQVKQFPAIAKRIGEIEAFVQKQQASVNGRNLRTVAPPVIKIPVIVHVLYNSASQNIPNAQIYSQLEVLNKDFRHLNADTINTPQRFRTTAADVQIEFHLATADPKGRPTDGIIRKQTFRTFWTTDDKIKLSSEGGDNAWDSKSYLNIWVGNLMSSLAYATLPGSDATKDGLVVSFGAFGTNNSGGAYSLGRTAVHEIGHWLGLKHIWGDAACGDDGVADTPKQGGFTSGCPSTFRSSCSNGTLGDMYMNYMDYTNDACMNMFTNGQKDRMRALFTQGGPRESLLTSKGLNAPWMEAAALPDVVSDGFAVYPNPALSMITINMGNDETWIGKTIQLVNIQGVSVQNINVSSMNVKANVSQLPAGVYFLKGVNNSIRLMEKIVKL